MRAGRTAKEERQKRYQERTKGKVPQTPEQRLQTLDRVFGADKGAKNERARAKAKIAAQRKKNPSVKSE